MIQINILAKFINVIHTDFNTVTYLIDINNS